MEAIAPERIIRERYRVLHPLGEGSSARTLACLDLVEERHVAVKELRVGQLESWKQVEMFEREAKALAGLRHQGIPEIHEFFEHEELGAGLTLYLVQELIDGPALQSRIGQAPLLGESDVLDIALGVLDILEYLHGRTPPLYHRDIKPSNIVLRKSGAPVLVDFGGVCHGWRPEQSGGSTVTGTYGYMPPEQLMGRVSPQSDLYALGATLCGKDVQSRFGRSGGGEGVENRRVRGWRGPIPRGWRVRLWVGWQTSGRRSAKRWRRSRCRVG